MALPAPHGPVPSARQLAWHAMETIGFVHFTQNTFSDREWGFGDEDPAAFNPTRLDCGQWAAAAREAGLTGLILTAKHHDGFCLWPTRTTRHSIAASPFRGGQGDLVREFADACRAAGLKVGLYCSPWDRNHAGYGTPAYTDCYHAQVRELLTGYGELFEFWFDGANGGDGWYGGAKEKRSIDRHSYYRFPELWRTCHELQPGAVLFSDAGPDVRWVGNECGVGGETCWSKVRPEGFAPGDVAEVHRLPHGDADGTVWRPAEVDVSVRPGWFWHASEEPKTAEHLFELWLASVGRGAQFLLNITPDRRGLIPDEDRATLRGMRALIDRFTRGDVAYRRPVSASSERPGCEAANLVDGRPDTCWAAADGVTAAEICIEPSRAALLGGIRIEEHIAFGQRVSAFAVDGWHYGHWLELARGTTIGPQRILRLPPLLGERIRVRILAAQAPPVLRSIQVYPR